MDSKQVLAITNRLDRLIEEVVTLRVVLEERSPATSSQLEDVKSDLSFLASVATELRDR